MWQTRKDEQNSGRNPFSLTLSLWLTSFSYPHLYFKNCNCKKRMGETAPTTMGEGGCQAVPPEKGEAWRRGKHHHPQDGLERGSSTIQEQRVPNKATSLENDDDLLRPRMWPSRLGMARVLVAVFSQFKQEIPKNTLHVQTRVEKQRHAKGGWESSTATKERWREAAPQQEEGEPRQT